MGIKNFSFLLLAGIISLTVGCESIERRQNQAPVTPSVPTYSAPNKTAALPTEVPSALTPPPPQRVPPVGVFLGPGAMRSFAHIGVLRALQRAQVPIVAIGGMEWGSVVAAAYAVSKSPYEVEWEMMKLKQEQVPTTTLLHRQLNPLNPGELAPFLKAAFADKDFDRANITFRCPYTDGDQTFFVTRGLARDQLPKCTVLPPLYNTLDLDGKSVMAAAVNPGDWSGELRRAGAQFIIYVDVISRGPLVHNSVKYADSSGVKALWAAIKTLSIQQHGFANLTIEVPMDYDLSDFDRRREAITLGDEAAKNSLSTTLKAIGMAN